jgi:hypothetical protein
MTCNFSVTISIFLFSTLVEFLRNSLENPSKVSVRNVRTGCHLQPVNLSRMPPAVFSAFLIYSHRHWAAGLQKAGSSIFNKVGDCGHIDSPYFTIKEGGSIYNLDFR